MKGKQWLISLLIASGLSIQVEAQVNARIFVADSASGAPLVSATVRLNNTIIKQTNDSGIARFVLPAVTLSQLRISHSGYASIDTTITLSDAVVHLYLSPVATALEIVTIIASTRTDQRIENAPMKVEVLGAEEMDEENSIRPANIASLLGDISGIQIQQSSAVSGNSNVRIQGLEGRYTQILRDGMPLFEGFSGSFGILQIPPLDLKQIELIKGSASTLYGGGAIGGLINLISRKPSNELEGDITVNQTTLDETNVNVYTGKREQHIGYNFFGGFTRQSAQDVNADGFSDIPKLRLAVIHPRLLFYPSNQNIAIGYTGTFEQRSGGDMTVLDGVKNSQHQFFETNHDDRHTGDLHWQWYIKSNQRLELKSVISSFSRNIETSNYRFKGNQLNYNSELAWISHHNQVNWVGGVNVTGDRFKKLSATPVLFNNFSNVTVGMFLQNTWQASEQTTIETGMRLDRHRDYGSFLLPRLAVFHRFNDTWAGRAGVGLGYKTPDLFAPQLTETDVTNLAPLPSNIRAEKSVGYNAEINYKKRIGDEASLFINHAFFLTSIQKPLVANENNGVVSFANAGRPTVSKGFDTYIKLTMDEWELYAGYTYTVAVRTYLSQDRFVPLTPRNRFAFIAAYDLHETTRMALEGSFTGSQYRLDHTTTPAFLFIAAVVSHTFADQLTVVLNVENLLDYRQSRKETLYTGTTLHPEFKPLWAPIDGRVANASVKWSWAHHKHHG